MYFIKAWTPRTKKGPEKFGLWMGALAMILIYLTTGSNMGMLFGSLGVYAVARIWAEIWLVKHTVYSRGRRR